MLRPFFGNEERRTAHDHAVDVPDAFADFAVVVVVDCVAVAVVVDASGILVINDALTATLGEVEWRIRVCRRTLPDSVCSVWDSDFVRNLKAYER